MDESKEMASMPDSNCINIATISAGFEKGDFLVREEQGNRVYFDFFEEVCEHLSVFFLFSLSPELSLVSSHEDIKYRMCLCPKIFNFLTSTVIIRHLTTFPIKDTAAWHEKMKSIGLI